MRKWLAREFFISHGEIVDEESCDGYGLLQVLLDYMVVGVHVGVRCTRVMALHVIADPLEARQADLVKRSVIAGHTRDRKGGSPEVLKWPKQFAKHRPGGLIALQKNSANAARAIIEIEIGVEVLVLGLRF